MSDTALTPDAVDMPPVSLNDTYYATEPIKLTADELAQLWRRVDIAEAAKEKTFLPTYKTALELWRGQHYPADTFANPWDARLVLNIIPNTIKSLCEAVSYNLPDFTITPRNAHGEAIEPILHRALDYWWDESQVQPQLKFATYDAKNFGVGFVQTGWAFRTEKVNLDSGRLPTLPAGMPASGAVLAEELGLLAPGEKATDFIPEDDLIEDRFLARRVDPVDMVWPMGASTVVDEWPWIAKVSRIPLAQLRQDPRLRHKGGNTKVILETGELQGTTRLSPPYDAYADYLPDEIQAMDEDDRPLDVRFVEVVEYWERDRRIHVLLCREDRTRYLLCEKWQQANKRYPFRVISNNPLPGELVGISVPVSLWHVQIELNVSRSANLEHARQFNRLYQAPEDSLSNKGKAALEAGRPGTVVEYKLGPWGSNPLAPLQHMPLQPEYARVYEWALQGAEQLSGLSQYQLSSPPSKRLTEDEVQTISQAHGILFLADAAAFTKLAKEVAEDLLSYCEQFEAVIQNLGIYDTDTDMLAWTHFSGREIRDNTLVSISPGSTQPPDAASELQKQEMILKLLLEAAQVATQLGGQLPRSLAITFREMLRIIGARDVDGLLPLPPPAAAFPPAPLPPVAPPAAPPGPAALPASPPGPAALPLPAPPAVAPVGPGGPTPDQVQQLLNTLSPEEAHQLANLLAGGH